MRSYFMEWMERNSACNKIQYEKTLSTTRTQHSFSTAKWTNTANEVQSTFWIFLPRLLRFFTRAFSSADLDLLKNLHNR